MSHALALDSDFNDRAFIYGGSGVKIGQENLGDLWELNLKTYEFTEIR